MIETGEEGIAGFSFSRHRPRRERYCPGTEVAGLASGRQDALVALAGVSLGSLLATVASPAIEVFSLASDRGAAALPKLLSVNHWVVIGLLAVMAGVMFVGIRVLAKQAAHRRSRSGESYRRRHDRRTCPPEMKRAGEIILSGLDRSLLLLPLNTSTRPAVTLGARHPASSAMP